MLNYYKIKYYVDSKLRIKMGLLKNNPNIGLFLADKWKIELSKNRMLILENYR